LIRTKPADYVYSRINILQLKRRTYGIDTDLQRTAGLDMIAKRFINTNVLEALKFQEHAKQVFLLEIGHAELRATLREFIGGRCSFIYEGLKSGKVAYLSYVLQKPAQKFLND
jgi:hypothetical protein